MPGRRESLKIIGAIGATCAHPFSASELYGQHSHPVPVPQAAADSAPRFFTPDEFAMISKIAGLIIPDTSTPGAVAAGVPAYIDRVVAANERFQKVYRDGLAWVARECGQRHKKSFVELDESEQIALLTPLCEAADAIADLASRTNPRNEFTNYREPPRGPASPQVEFFRAMKSMTADGYYTSKIGLVDELGYAGNTVLAEFPSCEEH
jgi:hypothetical protein